MTTTPKHSIVWCFRTLELQISNPTCQQLPHGGSTIADQQTTLDSVAYKSKSNEFEKESLKHVRDLSLITCNTIFYLNSSGLQSPDDRSCLASKQRRLLPSCSLAVLLWWWLLIRCFLCLFWHTHCLFTNTCGTLHMENKWRSCNKKCDCLMLRAIVWYDAWKAMCMCWEV